MSLYGCHNRAPLKQSAVVANGWYQDGMTRTPRMISIPDPMTKTCNYTTTQLGKADAKCVGCTHKQTTESEA